MIRIERSKSKNNRTKERLEKPCHGLDHLRAKSQRAHKQRGATNSGYRSVGLFNMVSESVDERTAFLHGVIEDFAGVITITGLSSWI
jgi:hypothetical protein